MLAAAAAFSLMAAVVKALAGQYSAYEIVFYRGLTGLALLGGWAWWRGLPLASPHPRLHVTRSVVGTVAMTCWFHTLGELPLGTAMTLNYTSPIFIAMLLGVFAWHAGRQVGPGGFALYAAIACGFAGVLLVLRPTLARDQELALVIGLCGGLLGSVAYLHVRKLGRSGEPEWRTVSWFSATNLMMGMMMCLPSGFSALDARGIIGLAGVGVLATAGQLFMTRAFGHGRTLLAASLQYAGVAFASLLGWLAFDERIDALEIGGILMIVASGVAATTVSARADTRELQNRLDTGESR